MKRYFLNKSRWLSHAAFFLMGYGFAVHGVILGLIFMLFGFILDIAAFKIAQNKNSSAVSGSAPAGRFPP